MEFDYNMMRMKWDTIYDYEMELMLEADDNLELKKSKQNVRYKLKIEEKQSADRIAIRQVISFQYTDPFPLRSTLHNISLK